MAEDWEELDESSLSLPSTEAADSTPKTAGERLLEEEASKRFADEDVELDAKDGEDSAAPRSSEQNPEQQKASSSERKQRKGTRAQIAALEKEKQEKQNNQSMAANAANQPLDDPTAEKLRQQRLQEEADLQVAADTFAGANAINLDTFVPKTEAEHEQFAELISKRYLKPLAHSGRYQTLLKSLIRHACTDMRSTEVKEVENAAVVLRNEKVKAEKEKESKRKKGGAAKNNKKFLNAGASGGNAGSLEDVDQQPLDVDDDGFDGFV